MSSMSAMITYSPSLIEWTLWYRLVHLVIICSYSLIHRCQNCYWHQQDQETKSYLNRWSLVWRMTKRRILVGEKCSSFLPKQCFQWSNVGFCTGWYCTWPSFDGPYHSFPKASHIWDRGRVKSPLSVSVTVEELPISSLMLRIFPFSYQTYNIQNPLPNLRPVVDISFTRCLLCSMGPSGCCGRISFPSVTIKTSTFELQCAKCCFPVDIRALSSK